VSFDNERLRHKKRETPPRRACQSICRPARPVHNEL